MGTEYDDNAKRGRRDDPALTDRLKASMLCALAGEGYEAVGLDRIARECGTSKQALYRRWASKEDFARTVLEERLARILPPVPERANASRDLFRILESYRTALVGDLGRALIRARGLGPFTAMVTEFENAVRFQIRQCLIATPFERALDMRAELLLGFLWQEMAEEVRRREGSGRERLETAIYLVLGLVGPQGGG